MKHPVFSFFLNYLTASHIHYVITDDTDTTLSDLDLGLRSSILMLTDIQFSRPLSRVDTHTIYHITDYYECCYSFFKFPENHKYCFIGPYLTRDFSSDDISDLMNSLAIPAALFSQLQDYYCALPNLHTRGYFSTLLRQMYADAFSAELPAACYLDLKKLESHQKFIETHHFYVSSDSALSMQLLEERYHVEDALLDAVMQGNYAKAFAIADSMSSYRITPRTADSLRNRRNLLLSFNTLMRRTAYIAGVHPFYLDTISGNYTTLIEKCESEDDFYDITQFLIRSYCDLIKKHSMNSYSEPIRHILVTVDASLTGDLTLKHFAAELYLNTSYLSALFKKEVGMTLTDYVNKSRIAHAKRLLKSTALSIQDIAVKSGIPDVHYFTRLFRRETGMTPRKWRSS